MAEYLCTLCNDVFANKKYLQSHLNRKIPCNRVIQCKRCTKIFNKVGDLNRHLNRVNPCLAKVGRTINDIYTIPITEEQCSSCLQTYSTKSSLKRHIKTCKSANMTNDMLGELEDLKNDKIELNILRERVSKLERIVAKLMSKRIHIKSDSDFAYDLKEYYEHPTDCVYFIKQIRQEPRIKIGFSKNIKLRKNNMKTANSDLLEVIAFIETSNMQELEKEFHDALQDHNICGEWFEFTEDDMIDILINYRDTGDIVDVIEESDESED